MTAEVLYEIVDKWKAEGIWPIVRNEKGDGCVDDLLIRVFFMILPTSPRPYVSLLSASVPPSVLRCDHSTIQSALITTLMILSVHYI